MLASPRRPQETYFLCHCIFIADFFDKTECLGPTVGFSGPEFYGEFDSRFGLTRRSCARALDTAAYASSRSDRRVVSEYIMEVLLKSKNNWWTSHPFTSPTAYKRWICVSTAKSKVCLGFGCALPEVWPFCKIWWRFRACRVPALGFIFARQAENRGRQLSMPIL